MELSEGEVRSALFELENRGLVRVLADARVPKYEHRMRDPLQLRRDEVAVLCLLLLRGPQTAAELRARAERLYNFDDTAAALATLERLAGREDPVVRILARQPGAREARWRHLVDGVTDDAAVAANSSHTAGGSRERTEQPLPEDLLARISSLEARVASLEERLGQLASTFGME